MPLHVSDAAHASFPSTEALSEDSGVQLRECSECGLLHELPPLAPGQVAACLRCRTVLSRARHGARENPLAFALTGFLLLLVVVFSPFMSLSLAGRSNATHFTSGAFALDQYDLWELTVVVLGTTLLAPLAKLGCIIATLGGLRIAQPPQRLYLVFRWVGHLNPWAMVEVYMLGIFVAYSKLVDLAHVQVGLAVYALATLMLAMAAADATLDSDDTWERLEQRGLVADPARLAVARRLRPARPLACHGCGLVSDADRNDHCPRCHDRLHPRKPDSLARSWALLVAAALMYIPANILPVLTLISLGRGAPSTIIGGVRQLVAAHLWVLAVLVFAASITVPLLKIFGLALMLLSVHRRARRKLRDRTLLYRIVESIGRWSMIDVFMISILTGLVHLGLIADVRPGLGALAFASVVVLTMLAAATFDPRLMWDAAGRNPGHELP